MKSDTQPTVTAMVHCRVCLRNIKSRTDYFEQHVNQQAHKEGILARGLVADPGPVPAQYYCLTCNKLVDTSTATLDAHVKTSEHNLCLRTAAILQAESECTQDKLESTKILSSKKRSKKRKRAKAPQQEDTEEEEYNQDCRDGDYVPEVEQGVPSTPRRSARTVVKPEFPDSISVTFQEGATAPTVGSSFDERFLKMGPQIPRVLGIDINLYGILIAARARLRKQSGKQPNLSQHGQETVRLLFELVPCLSEHIQLISPKKLRELADSVQDAALESCSSDAFDIKSKLPTLLSHVADTDTATTSSRGFKDRFYGRINCPVSENWDKHSVRQGLVSGELTARGDIFTYGLYKEYTCNREDVEEGLLRNEGLIAVYKQIFTERSGVSKRGALSNAQRAGMAEVTPRSIAYAACLMRFAASDKSEWALEDGAFDYRHYYSAVVNIFDDEFAEASDLLMWWNQRVFAKEKRKLAKSTLDILKEQRESKRARPS